MRNIKKVGNGQRFGNPACPINLKLNIERETMIPVEFDTTVEVNEVEVEVHVVAEFHPAVSQGWDGDGGRAEAVFLDTVTDVHSVNIKQFLGDIEREILRAEVIEEAT